MEVRRRSCCKTEISFCQTGKRDANPRRTVVELASFMPSALPVSRGAETESRFSVLYDDLDQDKFPASAVELAIKDLLPEAKDFDEPSA